MIRLLPAVGLFFTLAACISPEYVSPTVSEHEISRYAAPRLDALPEIERPAAEREAMVERVEARMRPAIEDLCLEVAEEPCSFQVAIEEDETPNAFAKDGGRIAITTGLMRHLETDDELAFVLGHEIAHHMADHLDETRINMTAGQVVGILLVGGLAAAGGASPGLADSLMDVGSMAGSMAGRGVYSKEQEREADYLGIYAMTLAGYDPEAAAIVTDKFQLFGAKDGEADRDETLAFFGTHPSSAEREARLMKVVAEIALKQEAGEPLLPNKPED